MHINQHNFPDGSTDRLIAGSKNNKLVATRRNNFIIYITSKKKKMKEI